jgi:serine/threonine protein phosphatase PrpC
MGYCYTRDAGLFALADGMGGHPEGEVASQLALQTLAAMFQRDCKPTLPDPLRFLHESIVSGHHQLLRYATQKALIDTPRTTVVACLLQGNAAYWAHCGDSRLYLVRGDKLIARTRDHLSELQETCPGGADRRTLQPQRALTSGQPGNGGRHAGPVAAANSDRCRCVPTARGGSVSEASEPSSLRSTPLSRW